MKNNLINIFNEIDNCLLNLEKPSKELNVISERQDFKEYPFSLLYKLKSTEQSKVHHPEGNVWIHTMMVLDCAATQKNKSIDKRVFMWAAFLHDIGKPAATAIRNGRITSYDHDKIGASTAKEFLTFFKQDEIFIEKVCNYIYFHMHPSFILNNRPFADVKKMKKSVDAKELALLYFCDKSGRLFSDAEKERMLSEKFIEIASLL